VLILPLALLLGAAACGGEVAQTIERDTTWVTSADPELAEMAEGLLQPLALKAGLKLSEPVRVEWRSKEALERYLRVKVDEELPVEEANAMSEAYRLLGLFPSDVDLRALLLELHLEQVAGFYDPDSTALFVMEGQPEAMTRTILVHELVHAIQDQTTSLDSITAKERGGDAQTAAQSAIEGHATLVMLEFMAEEMQGTPVDVSQIPDFASRIQPMLEAARSQYPALARAPRVVQESLLYPYLAGAGFVQALWMTDDERPAPFGVHLPQSTEQINDPSRLTGPTPDHPTQVTLTGETEIAYSEGLGQLGTRILLEELVGAEAGRHATGWDGDRFALWESPDETLTWVTVWDDDASRDAFVGSLVGAGHDVTSGQAQGRPVAIFQVGQAHDVAIELVGGM